MEGLDEWGAGARRHAQGRVRPDRRRQARELGRQRPALRGLGDLPPEGLAGRPESDLRVADRAAGSARSSSAPTTAARPGSRSATSSPTTAMPGTHQWYDGTPHPWEFKRVWHLEPSLHRPRHGLRRRRGRGAVPLDRRRRDLARAAGPARPRLGPHVAARRGRHVPAHDPARPERTRSASSSRSRPPGAFRTDDGGETWQPINRGCVSRVASPIPTPKSATACTASRCTRRARTCCSCRSTGT